MECGTLLVHLGKIKARKPLFFNGFQAFCNYSYSTTQEISYICGDETIDKSTFTTFYSSLIGLKAQTKDESLVQAKDAEFTAVFHMTDGDLTFAYSPYDSSFYYTVDEDGVPSLVNKNNVKTMVENYETLLAAKTEDDSSSDTAE